MRSTKLKSNDVEKFGGVARRVLRRKPETASQDEAELNAALTSMKALESLRAAHFLKDLDALTHLLIKIFPEEETEFRGVSIQLASPYVRQQLVKRSCLARRTELWNTIEEGAITGIADRLFEEAWHQFMQNKDIPNFKLHGRKLAVDGDSHDDQLVEFTGALTGLVVKGDPPETLEDRKYYQPYGQTFVAVDSWTSKAVFQVTTDRRHELKLGSKRSKIGKVIMALAGKHGGKAKLYFVVPRSVFADWKTVQKITGENIGDLAGKVEQSVVCFEQNLPSSS